MVKRAGYDPIAVESGELALDRIEKADPRIDLLVLDLVMPDLDGMGVLTRMRDAGQLDAHFVQAIADRADELEDIRQRFADQHDS